MKQSPTFRLQSFSFFLQAICLLSLGALLLLFPGQTSAGVSQGLQLCFSTLIGALLPFLVVSKLFLLRGLHRPLMRQRSFFMRRVLGLPDVCAAVLLFSMVGGYPVGASMAADLKRDGSITQNQAQRLLLFCVGPGPSFAVSAVGVGMLHSAKAGVVLYAGVICGALLTGMLSRLFFRTAPTDSAAEIQEPPVLPLAAAIDRAVKESVQSMLLICGFVALFSALLQLLQAFDIPQSARLVLAALLEVTNACKALSPQVSLPVLALVAAWGGVCTHCQLSPFIVDVQLPYARFVCFRAVHAGCSFLCCRALLLFIKLPVDAIRQNALRPAVQPNCLLSVCMCMMCVLLLFGSNWSMRLTRTK